MPSLDRQGWRRCFGVLAVPERIVDFNQALVAALEMLAGAVEDGHTGGHIHEP